MARYFYNTENGQIESEETIRTDYFDVFGADYETFSDYLSACMTDQNGVLITLDARLAEVKREWEWTYSEAMAYGYDEYAEELAELLAEIDRLRKLKGRA